MGEYQHYAFAAIDRQLTRDEIAALRAIEGRATVSPAGFVAEYHAGDLDVRPEDLLVQYFDAHAYVSSWGTSDFTMRMPQGALVREVVKPYLVEERVEVRQKPGLLLLTLHQEFGDDPTAAERAASWLPAIQPLRADLMGGDMRALYLGWLSAVQDGAVPDDAPEPPVPPGLDALTPALEALARFFRLAPGLIAVAAEPAKQPRTAKALRAAGKERAAAQASAAADQANATRNKALDALKAREEQLWAEVAETIVMPGGGPVKTAAYKAKGQLLRDLRDLADRDGTREAFDARLAALREQHRVPGFWMFYDPPRKSSAFGG